MQNRENINVYIGQKFGKLTVLAEVERKNRSVRVLAECGCDHNHKVYYLSALKSGGTKSCGCVRKKHLKSFGNFNRTHGLRNHPLYQVWRGMKKRCYDQNASGYKSYGGRGIFVCDKWLHSFINFYNDMVDGYITGLQLDRIDNNQSYFKDNCRWVTPKIQSRNRRNNRLIYFENQNKTVAQWAEEKSMSYMALYHRLYDLGWSVEKALTNPVS